ncbi:MAG: GNAT family N-acetyltransferase [Pseudoflavonifractor sp.]
MFEIRDMKPEDHDRVLPMVTEFYHSSAVDHDVDSEILERTFRDAVDENDPILRGVVLWEDDRAVGYGYVTTYYAAEVGGRCLMMEELYFTPECRGKGYGTQFFRFMMDQYPEHKRFRLEVTEANRNATRLYERWGFQMIGYNQMILDRE